MLTPSLLTKPFSKLVRRHAALVYSFNFFSLLATHYYKTPCYKNSSLGQLGLRFAIHVTVTASLSLYLSF